MNRRSDSRRIGAYQDVQLRNRYLNGLQSILLVETSTHFDCIRPDSSISIMFTNLLEWPLRLFMTVRTKAGFEYCAFSYSKDTS